MRVAPGALLLCCLAAWGQSPAPVGRISGGEFRVRGQVEFAADGSALLLSGAEVEVRSGTARLALAGAGVASGTGGAGGSGGEARFCGPLKITVLKGSEGDAPLLFALDTSETGSLELDGTGAASHSVQTPFFAIAAVPVAGAAARRLAVRVAASGDTCVAALAGSLRVREQLGPSELLIPPGKAMLIPAAGVEKAMPVEPHACGCGAPPVRAAAAEPAPAPPQTRSAPETKTTIATAPLVYQAAPPGTAAPPSSPPKEAEVTLPVVVSGAKPADAAQEPAPAAAPAPPPKQSGFGAKLKRFFRALLGLK